MSISEKEIKEIEKPKELKTKNGIPYKIISHEEGLNRHERRANESMLRTEKSRTRKLNIFLNKKDMADRKRKAIALKIQKKRYAKISQKKL